MRVPAMHSDANLTSAVARPTGQATMSPAMADMQAYPAYLYGQVRNRLGTRVWEIGIGNGQTVLTMLREGRTVLGSDIATECLERVSERVRTQEPGHAHRFTTAIIDLEDAETVESLASFQADTVISFNVLEHIEKDVDALRAIRQAMAPQGHIALIVPAHPRLYGKMDREAGHHRRYTRQSLEGALRDAGWIHIETRYINAVGALGWWIHNRFRRNAGLKDAHVNRQMRAADRWLPILSRWTDPWTQNLGGLSVVAVASVPSSASKA